MIETESREGYTVEVDEINGSAGETFTLISRTPVVPEVRLSKNQILARAAEAEAAAEAAKPRRKKITRKVGGRRS